VEIVSSDNLLLGFPTKFVRSPIDWPALISTHRPFIRSVRSDCGHANASCERGMGQTPSFNCCRIPEADRRHAPEVDKPLVRRSDSVLFSEGDRGYLATVQGRRAFRAQDFAMDGLATERALRVLTVVDGYLRSTLCCYFRPYTTRPKFAGNCCGRAPQGGGWPKPA
jgi:hypothetical protein